MTNLLPRFSGLRLDRSQVRPAGLLAAALAIGLAGGLGFEALGLPAAWLSGPMIAVGLAALFGLRAAVPNRLRDGVFFLLGLSMGAGVTPEMLERVGAWPVSLAGLAATVGAVIAATYVFLRRVPGWDPASAYFGSIPGALSMTLATAEASRANLTLVSLSQTMRLFMLVAVLPPLVLAGEPAGIAPGGGGAAVLSPAGFALLVAAGGAGAVVAAKLRVPAGVLIGAFLVSAALHGLDVVHGQLPLPLLTGCYLVLGVTLGLRFAGTGWRLVLATLVAGMGAFAVALAVSAAGAGAVAAATGLGFGQLLIAFAPGGLEAMMILAFVLQVDPAFVAAHHLARFVGMTFAVPILARWVLGPGWASAGRDGGKPPRDAVT